MTSPDRRRIELDVIVESDTRGLTSTTKGLDDTAKSADRAGDSFKRMSVDAKALGAEVQKTKNRIRELDSALVTVGKDKVLQGQLRGETAWLKQLEQISERLEKANNPSLSATIGGAAAGGGAGAAGLGGGGGGGRLSTGPVVAGAIAGLAPWVIPLGAMIAGTVSGAIGTGGIAGGIAMASRDPRVKAAAEEFSQNISKEFFKGDAFVGPVLGSLNILEGAFKDMDLEATFAKMAPHVTTIAAGLGDLGRNIMPGLNKAFDRMGPFAATAAEGFGQLGTALGTFMDDVTSSEGAVEGLAAMFTVLSGAIVFTGKTLNVLSDMFDFFNGLTIGVADFSERLFALNPAMRAFFENAKEGMIGVAESGNAVKFSATAIAAAQAALIDVNQDAGEQWKIIEDRIRGALKAQNEYFDSTMAVPEANDALQASFDAFTASLKENGRTFDENTEKGRNNRQALRDMISAAQDLRTAQINAGQSTTDVNRRYEESIARIEEMANDAGVSADELRRMAGDYYVNIYRKELTHKVTYFSNHDLADTRTGRAEGGPVMAGVPYLINERGYETVTFPAGGTVHPANLTPMTGGLTVNVYPAPFTSPAETGAEVVKVIRQYEMVAGTGWRG